MGFVLMRERNTVGTPWNRLIVSVYFYVADDDLSTDDGHAPGDRRQTRIAGISDIIAPLQRYHGAIAIVQAECFREIQVLDLDGIAVSCIVTGCLNC